MQSYILWKITEFFTDIHYDQILLYEYSLALDFYKTYSDVEYRPTLWVTNNWTNFMEFIRYQSETLQNYLTLRNEFKSSLIAKYDWEFLSVLGHVCYVDNDDYFCVNDESGVDDDDRDLCWLW